MKKRLITRHPVAELASLLLFGIFVLFLLLMLLFSARIYQQTVKNTNAENTMGTRIREMRKAAGMSQEQLAEILCTKKATISAYENDHIDIKSSIVLEIAKALNCSGSYLLEGKKAEALDARIMDALLELKNDQMREVALKQIQALALLG